MKLLFDNNLSVRVPLLLQDYFPGGRHVFDLNISYFSDPEIWQFAKENEYAIVTKDKNFYYMSNTFGSPPKVIWLTVSNCRNTAIVELLIKKKTI